MSLMVLTGVVAFFVKGNKTPISQLDAMFLSQVLYKIQQIKDLKATSGHFMRLN